MSLDALKETVQAVQNVATEAMKQGIAIGRREGLLRAAEMCEEKSKVHAEYLPPNFQHKDGDHDQAATCGRRDECSNLAYEIRQEANKT